MSTSKHPKQEIQKAIEYAVSEGWRIIETGKSSHAFCRLYCPEKSRNGCKSVSLEYFQKWKKPFQANKAASRQMSSLNMMKKDKIYNFTLTLEGVNEPSEDIENALFEAKCDDAILYFRNQIGYLEFERVSGNLESAIISAINDVESAGINAKIARVEPADLVTSAEISRRLNRSRESIRLLIKGSRGSGNFPTPIAGVSSKTLIWSWAEVSKWFYVNNKIEDPFVVKKAQVIREINDALEIRYEPYSYKKVNFFISRLNNKKTFA